MIVGIDVGGTNVDAVLLKDLFLIEKAKIPIEGDLLESIIHALNTVIKKESPESIKRVVLSTTLSTNSILQNKLPETGMIVSGGPGMDPECYRTSPYYYTIKGAIDHRGHELTPLDKPALNEALKALKKGKINFIGAVTKYSIRNPKHELEIKKLSEQGFQFTSMGHTISGSLGFPRRINSAYLNAAVWKLYRDFIQSALRALKSLGINSPVYVLKADGGTMFAKDSVNYPLCTILSGPAASIMGLMAMSGKETFIGLDIGGTTTDISLFYKGSPVFENEGISIGSYKTNVKGLISRSVGVGGDSMISVVDSMIHVGPLRKGPAMAFGGSVPTLIDALIVAENLKIGDREKSLLGITGITKKYGNDPVKTAQESVKVATEIILSEIKSLLDVINSKPVYTIHEMLNKDSIEPETIVSVGGPAKILAKHIAKGSGLNVKTPEHSEVGNAIGAALSRVTSVLTLIADTEIGTLFAVEEDYNEKIDRNFRIGDLKQIAKKLMNKRETSPEYDSASSEYKYIEEQEFNMVRGFCTTGRNIRVKIQQMPALIGNLKPGG